MFREPPASLLVVAAFSRHGDALDWAQAELTRLYGPVENVSADFDFHHTAYYAGEMGPGLRKRLIALGPIVAPDCLPAVKRRTIELEAELAATGRYPEARPLNLDPGLVQLGKFLLATTKDQAHRIYLSDNIFAEVTLRFHDGAFEPWPWTYADYREPDVRTYLAQVRASLHAQVKARKARDDR